MKILMVLMGMEIGGAETHVLELSADLKNKGYDVLIASNGGVYTKELENLGIKHINLPLNTRNIFSMTKSFFGLLKIIKNEKPDIVHSHARIPSFILSILNKFIKFNFVTSAHWVFDTSGILKYITKWGSRCVAVSEDIKIYLKDNYHVADQDIYVTINGINMRKFSPDNYYEDIIHEFGLSKDKRKIVYISRMDEDRSLVAHQLIKIAPDLLKKEDLEIIIVGGGNDYDKVLQEAQIQNEKAGKRYICLTGARTDIYKFISVADFFVGVSRSALEAMSAAVPSVIAGNEGYIGIFDEKVLDICVNTNFCCRGTKDSSPALLKEDLMYLLNLSNNELKNIGDYSREIIKANYSVDAMSKDYEKMYESILKTPQGFCDVVVSGYYGHKNSGDDALLSAIIKDIKAIDNTVRFTVLSKNPRETKKIYGVDAVYRFNFLKVNKAIKNSRLLISGGGSLIQDATSSRSLLYYLNIIKTALKNSVKTYVYANGVGPINRPKNKKITSEILNKVDLITLRESHSKDVLKEIQVNKPEIIVTSDPAISITPSPTSRVEEIFKIEGIPTGRYAVISLRNWKTNAYKESVIKLSEYLLKKYSLNCIFVPMQPKKDFDICMQCSKFGYVLKNSYSSADIMSVAANSDLVIGMRLHMLMYGVNAGVPVVGLSYDPKVTAYLSYLNQSYTIDSENLSYDQLKKIVDDIMENYDKIRLSLNDKVLKLKKLQQKNAELAIKLLEEKQ